MSDTGLFKVNLEFTFSFPVVFHFQVWTWFSNQGFKPEIHFIFQLLIVSLWFSTRLSSQT